MSLTSILTGKPSFDNDQSSRDQRANMQKYIFVFGLLELAAGLLAALVSDFISVFHVITFFAGTCGIVGVLFCVMQPASIKLYDVLGMALMLAYGTGTLNSLVSFILDGKDLLLGSSVSEYWLTRTLGLATAAAGFLHMIGRIDPRAYVFDIVKPVHDEVGRATVFIGIIAVTAVVFIAIGKLGFMGNISSGEGTVGISATTSILLDFMTPAGALALYLARKEERRTVAMLLFSMSAVLLLIQFGLGRRIFVFSLVVYMMAAVLAKRPKKLVTLKNIVIVMMIVLLIQAATTAFFVLRMARYTFKEAKVKPTIVEMVPEAFKIYQNRERLYLAEQMHANISTRSFVLEYLATLSERTDVIPPAYGENLVRAVVVATPSILYWEKYKNPLFASEEDILNQHFGMPVWDASNTVLTASVGDFGEAGFFFLPGIICFIFSLLIRLGQKIGTPVSGLILSFFIAKALLSVEEDLVAYFTSARSIVIIMVITYAVFAFKLRMLNPRYTQAKSS
jgi:hypothetical protein